MTFQMQSWTKIDGERAWKPMEDGAGRKVWLPRRTREEAVHKCIEWTGAILIPAMRVVDLDTAQVIWQDTSQYPDAGEPIVAEWTAVIYEQVRAENRRLAELNRCDCGMPSGTDACRKNHEDGIPPRHEVAPAAPADDGALFSLAELSS